MRFTILRHSTLRPLAVLVTTAWFLLAPQLGSEAAANPFDTLLGSWRGSGQILLSDGRRERLTCNAYYTGGGSQLGMAIRCQSDNSNVEIRSQLSLSGSRISGTWEERTYNASGTASGTASSNRISLSIAGGVSGSMQVNYSGSRQSVSISTQNIALKSVTISLSRS